MKKRYFLPLFLFAVSVNAQISVSILDQNNASASITDGGAFFSTTNETPAYKTPKDSLQALIYSATNWFAGTDAGGQLKFTGPDLYGANTDLWPGALTTGGFATAGTTPPGSQIWSVSKADIYLHLTNFQTPGYVVPAAIANWPAHGDIALGFDYNLAPFVDVDLDGNYDPSVGDYPCIKGDKASFMVMNDKKNVHGSGGDPIGLELHYMFYQYDSIPLQDVTFIDLRIINRGTITLFDFYTSFVMDGDLGNGTDDLFACDTNRNLQYYYNDATDESSGSAVGYGENPPSFGVVCLNHDIATATSLSDDFGLPNNPLGKYNVMRGLTSSGGPRYNNFLEPTVFSFYDNPNDTFPWTSPGGADQRTVMSVNFGMLPAFDEKSISYAIVYNRDGTSNLDNVNGLLQKTDAVQAFFDSSTDGNCSQSILAIENVAKPEVDFSVFPNPSNGQFTLQTEGLTDFVISVKDMTGRVVFEMNANSSETLVNLEAPEGIYLVTLSSEKSRLTKRIVIK